MALLWWIGVMEMSMGLQVHRVNERISSILRKFRLGFNVEIPFILGFM